MDLLSTRTPMPLTQPTEEKQQPVGARLLDNYVRNADHYEAEDVTPEFLAKHTYAKEGAASGLDFDSWSKQNGVTDFLANAQTTVAKNREQAAWDAAQPETRGFLAGTGAALGRGAMNVVGSMGHTLALADATPNAIDTDKGILDRAGEGMTKWAEDKKAKTQFMRPTMEEEKGETGAVKKAWEGGVESMVTSTAPMAAGFAGAKAGGALGAPLGPAGAAIGATIGGLGAYGLARFGMFGAGVYGDTYDKTYAELKQKNPGMGEDEVRRIANKGAWTDAISENVSEAVGDAAAFYTFGGSKVLQQPLKATIKDVMKRGLKGYATDVAKQMPFEVGSEMANAAVGAHWRNEAGLSGGDMAEAAKEAIGPAIVMSLLMGGGVAGYTEVKARKALANINGADPDVRARTANEIALQIKERTGEEDLAESWRQHAFERIGRGEEIELDEQLVKFGANRARIDAADAGQDIPVVTDETEQEMVQAAEPVTPAETVTPAESLLTGGAKQRPEDVLLGTDPIIPEPFNPAAQSPVIEQQRQAFDAAYAQDGLEEAPSAEEIAPVEAQAAEPQDLDAEWADREAAQQFDAEMRMRRAAIQAEAERARTRVKNLDSIPGKLNEKQMRNLDAERRKLMDAQAELEMMDRQGMTGMADEAEARGVEEFGPASVGDKQLATNAVVDKKAANNSDKADLQETVKVRTTYGDTVRVSKADLESDKPGLRLYKPDGTEANGYVVRDNLDMDGAKQAGRNKETGTPDIVYREDASGAYAFKSKAAAQRELSRLGLTNTHEVVAAEATGKGASGFVGARKQPADLPSAGTVTAPAQAEASTISQKADESDLRYMTRETLERELNNARYSYKRKPSEMGKILVEQRAVKLEDFYKKNPDIDRKHQPTPSAETSKKEPWQMTRGDYYQSVRNNEGAGKSNVRARPNWGEIKKIVGFDFFAEGNEVQPLKKQRFSGGFSEEQEAAIKDALSVQGFTVDKTRVRNNEEQDIPKGGGWRARSRDVFPTSPEHERSVRKALSEGKPVPAEVLAEYPDLAPHTLPADQRTKAQAEANNALQIGDNAHWGSEVRRIAHRVATSPSAVSSTREKTGAAPGQRPSVDEQFDTMVRDAARWQGAARNLARELKDDKRASLRLLKATTKGDLDAYLMRKYGIDASDARSVSNHLTARDIKPDFTATVEEFKDEPWAKDFVSNKQTAEIANTAHENKATGKANGTLQGEGLDQISAPETQTGAATNQPDVRRGKELFESEQKKARPGTVTKEQAAEAVKTFETAQEGDIYEAEIGGKKRFLIRGDHPRGGGDSIHDTFEQAVAYKEERARIDKANAETAERNKKKEDEQRAKAASDKAKYEDVKGYTDSMTPLARGLTLKRLNSPIRHNGQVMTRKEFVEKLVAEGSEITARQENKIKDMSRRQWNRATNEEQDYHRRKQAAAGKVTVHSIGDFDVSKTEYDYAKHLMGQDAPVPSNEIDLPAAPAETTTATPDLSTLSSSELTSLKAGQRVRYLGQDGAYSVSTVDDVYKVGNDIHVDFDDGSKFVANGKGEQKDTGSAATAENLTREDYADLFDEELAAAGIAAEEVKPEKKQRQGTAKNKSAGSSRTPRTPKKTSANTGAKTEPSARERAAKAAKKMADGAAAALDIFSKYGGLSVREVKTGDEVNQDLYSELKPHLMQVLEGAKELGHAGKDLAREVVRFLIKSFGAKAAKAKPYFMQFVDEEILSAPGETTQQGAKHDQRRNAGDNAAPLEGELSGEDEEAAEGLDNETGQGMRGADEVGDGRAEEDRAGRGDGVGGVDAPVLPDTAPGVRRGGLDSPLNPTEGRNKRQLSGENPGNFSIPEGFGLGEGSTGQKITANLEAIKTLKRIQAEHRFPTTEEQAVMARYVGWGGLANVFDSARAESTDMYGRAQRELRELLTDKEYSAAWSSTRNAHYTAPQVVEAMWQALEFFGFKGGRVLEPTVGVGNFLGMQPQHLAAATEWHASELDAITGQLAAMIYPEANVLAATGFQDAPFANGVFDAGIGNPPFGAEEIRDEKRPHLSGMKIHNYIIGKSGDHLRPGGVMAMVVTHRFLDTANPEARAYLAKYFRFVGAWRLPNDAFLKNAGTEVVTDVIFLQKLRADEKPDMKAAWLDVNGEVSGKDGAPVRVNRYYQENPQNILGESSMSGTMYRGGGQEYTVTSDGRDLRAAMSKVITESFANEQKILQATDSDRDLAPVMLEQSYLPIDGMILDEDGTIRRRDMDDIHGNAVVYEVTPETLWRDDAELWDIAVRNLRAVRDNGMSGPADEDALKKEVFSFAYNANGAEKPKPTKADSAVYRMVKAMTSPRFTWKYDDELAEIERALNRRKLGEDGYARLKGMLDLRNQTLALHAAEKQDHPSMEKLRRELRASYERFVKRFGFINDPKNLSLLGGGIGAEAGLEMSYDKGVSKDKSKSTGDPYREPSAKPADILLRRVNFPRKQITSAKSAPDSLHVSLTEKGRVDIGYMAKLLGATQDRVIADLQAGEHPLIFLDPDTNAYVDADEYLSGNVRHKLDLARAAGLPTNIRALEAAQPAPLSKERIFPNIRGMWMPKEIFEGFLKALGVTSPRVAIMHAAGKIAANGTILQHSEFGQQFKDDDADILDMFQAAVDGKPVQVWRGSGDDRWRDSVAEIRVNALVERMANVFPTWVYADDQRTSTVVDAFNQKMNTHVARKYDGEKYLVTVGANPSITLRRTQKNAAWRMMQSPAVLLDHVVGAGKTFTIITGIMERRRIGLSRKPMIVVPNHLVTQWAVDFYRLYPSARILAATPADFEKKNRRRLFARIASGDFDAVIVGHSSFGFIEAPADDIATMIGEKVDDLRMVLEEAKRNGSSKRTIKQMKARLDSYNDKLNALQARPHDAMGIDLHSMGVDYLAVDEAHEFKNLEYATSAERVVGMNDPVGSKKAFDLLVKLRGVRSRGGSVAFATGTPVSNSLVEIYSIMQYLAADDLKARNMSHFDAWSGAYVSTRTKLEYMPTQKLKARRVLAGLENLPSLRQLYESFADIITMADLKRIYAEDVAAKNKKNGTTEREEFPIPKVDGGSRQMDNGEISPAQSEYMDYLVARADAIESNKGPDYARIDNMLWVMSDARKAALDIRLVDPRAQRDENGKVARAAANIKRIYDKWNDKRGAQLVFCDLSVPAANADKGAKKSLTEIATSVFGDTQGKALMKRMAGQPYVDQWREMTARVEEMLDTPDLDDRTQNAAEKALEKLADIEGEVITADTKFSVYDDLRTMLRESGIPLNEIAFIHDYDSPEKKQELFARVRNGHVRVLIGSSSKMGAGMNAQDRLVALHHLDAPWRPSDMEQREGRIIRQGNVFYEEDPDNFSVEILAYSTRGTSDTVMWQILERKAAAIEQFRQGGLDTVTEESGDADQYAEFMANSTGNPVFRLKLEAERRMQELRAETGALLIAKQDAEVFLKDFASQIARAERDVKALDEVRLEGEAKELTKAADALNKAKEEYRVLKAEYDERIEEATEAMAAWKELPKKDRGEKPAMPVLPKTPTVLSKELRDKSPYFAAVAKMIESSEGGQPQTMRVGNVTLELSAEPTREGYYTWEAMLVLPHGNVRSLGATIAKRAEGSTNILDALRPSVLLSALESAKGEAERRVNRVKARKEIAERNARIDVDSAPLEQATAEAQWYARQVGFAEAEADARRAGKSNKYINLDMSRKLDGTGNSSGVKEAPSTIKHGNETYALTGIGVLEKSNMAMQAVRWRDGVPVIVNMTREDADKPWTVASVDVEPGSVRGITSQFDSLRMYQVATSTTPTPIDLREAFPWADSITERDGKTIITKGKVSFAVEQVESIKPDEMSFKLAYGRKPGSQDQIAGQYQDGTITLSKMADKWTVQHEFEHFLEDMGLITAFEQAVLNSAIKRAERDGTLGFDAAPNGKRMKDAELRAYYIQNALAKRDFDRKTTLGRVLQKIADFIDALVNLAMRTSRGVVRDVESGRAMGKTAGKQGKFMLPMLQAAYHGSPHRFEKFMLDHIGSGEGAQAYGYGLYFAGEREVAEFYRKGLSTPKETVTFENSGEVYELADTGEWVNQESGYQLEYDGPGALAAEILSQEYDLDQIREMIRGQEVVVNSTEYKTSDAQEALSMIEAGDISHKTEYGQLYKVEIPENDELLHWDNKLSAQPENVREMLEKVISTARAMGAKIGDNPTGADIYFALEKTFGTDREASKSLNALGIKGIKYLDGTSRSQGDGTYNFVIFDDNAIEMLETYYQTAQAAGATAEELAEAARLWKEMGTESPYFKKWSGGAPVVRKGGVHRFETGKAVVVEGLHGTDRAFDAFDVNAESRSAFDETGNIFFTSSDEEASAYAEGIFSEKTPDGANIIPAFIRFNNPMVETVYGDTDPTLEFDSNTYWGESAKYGGYDGLIVHNSDTGESLYVAFDPTQIKSAIGNRGTFDAEDPRIQYALANMQQARELRDDILKRPEVFGLFKNINTQLHKAMRQPAFKRIFDRFHAAAGTQQRAAARSASLAPDILPDHSGGFKQSVRELLTKTSEFSAADLRHVSKVLSMETLAGKNPSPFAGHRLTDDELARIERGETVKVGDNDVRMNGKQVRLYRQTRAALDQMLREMGTSEAWRIIRGVLTTHQSTAGDFDAKDYWEVFANNPLEAADAMKGLLEREKVKADARLTRATQDLRVLTGADDMDGAKEWGKQLVKLNKAIDNVGKFSQKQLEDDDLDELVAKRERRIDRLAEELGISAGEADATLKEYKGMVKEHTAATTHVENVKGATKSIGDVFAKTDQLIKAGYMPLSRFGQYRIDVRDEDGNLLHASFYDTSTEANRERRKLVSAFGQTGIVGEVETVSQEDWKLYQGQNPEALRLFAEAAGAESDEAIQAYYQDAISSRSALKRLINRQGYAGYSDDLQRILASFITSGSKRIGQNYHAADINDMVKDKSLPGDLRDEAIRLKSFIENPGDAGSSFRAFAANWYMLGSLMSAAWNGTQVVTSSLPELYKHSGSVGRSTKDIFGAYRSMVRKGSDLTQTEKQALDRAQEDGTVDAAEIHHLYAQATKRFINKLGSGEAAKKVGAFLRLWGMPFSWFETVNRKATFLAAYRMAERQGVDDPYALARSIVDVSQGIYSKHNRPNVARSAVGGAVLTFMQYKIMTLEQIARNAKEGGQARKAAALQLAIIAAMGGWKALPGIEDITDLYDIIAQVIFGQAVLSKKSMREAIEKGSKDAAGLVLEKDAADAVGKFFADAVNSGIVTAALPVDVSTRASMGSLVPGLKLLKPSVQYRDSIVFDMAGVPGSMIDSLIDASGMMLRGDMGGAAMRLAPNAVAAAAKGVDILATGEIKNTRGKKITDGDMVYGALQTIGAQPKAKSRINSRLYENQELKNLAQQEEKSIVGQWADAYDAKGIDARNSAIQAARQRIVDWNRRNPEWPIAIKQTQVLNELKNRKKTTVELATKTAPKELRPSMAVH